MSHNQPVLVILLELVDLFFAYASVPAPAPAGDARWCTAKP